MEGMDKWWRTRGDDAIDKIDNWGCGVNLSPRGALNGAHCGVHFARWSLDPRYPSGARDP